MFKRALALALVAAPAVPVAGQATRSPQPAPSQGQPLPRAQFLTNMDVEFKRMDADRDGALSKKEIEDYQTSQIIAAAEARKRALFAAMDSDHNGVLSPAEFMRLPSNERAPNGAAMIQQFDANHDNRISQIEYRTRTLANF